MGKKKSNLPQTFLRLTSGLDRVLCDLLRVDLAEWQAAKALWSSGTAWRVHTIPKKSGVRTLHIPADPLKRMQRGILEQVLRTFPVHHAVHGAHPKTSVVTNARAHAGFGHAFYLLDLKNAFPSVKRKRVEEYLVPKMIEMIQTSTDVDEDDAEKIARAIIDLIHIDDVLPQGFPTSPAVLNLVALPLDREIMQVLREVSKKGWEFRYTRFVDDLTISTNRAEIPEEVRVQIKKAIKSAGWKINGAKVRYHGLVEEGTEEERSCHMPIVTGLVPQLDGRVTIPRWRLNQYRGIIHKMNTFDRELTVDEHDQLVGLVGFVGMVYDDKLPAVIRKPYEVAKAKFHLGDRRETSVHFYPEE